MAVVPIVIGALGTIPKVLKRGLEEFGVGQTTNKSPVKDHQLSLV